ncbi:MAG: transcriptional regulator NrdR [Patescibacteria group bacterium]
MNCPFCNNSETKVVDSRDTNDGKAIRRRRECEKCQARFSTYEEVEIMRLAVIKKDGSKEEYDRRKIESGIQKALEKRPVSEEKIKKIIGDIEYEIQSRETACNVPKGDGNCEITSKEIGRIVLEKLKEIDDVAYLRFASVYKSFGSAESFKKEADKITQ